MKKTVFGVLLLLFLTGCGKDFNNVVDPTTSKYSVQSVVRFDTLRYNSNDSLTRFYIQIGYNTIPSGIYLNLYSPGDVKVNSSSFYMVDNGNIAMGDEVAGDKKYSIFVPMLNKYLSGEYRAEYFGTDKDGNVLKLAVSKFVYDNGSANQEPIISNLSAPDTITVVDTTFFRMTLKAIDPNGKQDLSRVYFVVTRPDGTSNNSALLMYDDGNLTTHGDEVANDDIYSIIISVYATNQKGEYTFTFNAEDRGKKKSLPIIKKIVIK
jgi:hypothetical protein